MLIHMNTWTVWKNLVKKKLPSKKCFHGSLKDVIPGDIGKKLIWSREW